MKFSIILPSWNNLKYLQLCIKSIQKNSTYIHDINVHLNEGNDGSEEFLKKINIKYKKSNENLGLCKGTNSAATLAETEYLIYTHDDMYFLPNWDLHLEKEIKNIKNNLYYFSGTMIGPISSGLQKFDFNCGTTADNFDENKLLKNYSSVEYFDHQGTHWAPHLIHKSTWDAIGGFSEEFDPGFASDTDLNMKLWKLGVRTFKGINNFRVYHFGSISLRKKKALIRNKGNRLFLKKWGISSDLFIKYYLRSGKIYKGTLNTKPNINISFLLEFFNCKIKYYLLKIFSFAL
jgi:GT2 family glycosyltransferase